MDLFHLKEKYPISPYVRIADYGVREPWCMPTERKLLDYLLIFIQEGICLFHVEGTAYEFQPGDFCFIQPEMANRLQGLTNTIIPYIHFDIFFNPDRSAGFSTPPGLVELSSYRHLIQPRLNDFDNVNIPVKLKPTQPARMRETLLKLIGLKFDHNLLSQIEADHLCMELIIQIMKDHISTEQYNISTPDSLNWITSYLSIHLSEPISIEDMAKRAQLSSSRFYTVFRNRFGMSPHQYLIRLRVQHAQELLKGTDFTHEQITQICGFADIYHFSKLFKKITGVSPGRFRLKGSK